MTESPAELVDPTDKERVAELRAEFDVSEQQAWKLLAAERGDVPVDRVEVGD